MKILKTMALAATLTVAATASAQSDYRLGLCDNSLKVSDLMVQGEYADTYEAAIYLTGADLARVSGGSFTGVNVGIATTVALDKIDAWIRTDLAGEDIAGATLSKSDVSKGWNAAKFETPVEIEADKGYYIGYTLKMTTGRSIMMLPVQRDLHLDNGCWYRCGTGEWADRNDLGTLFLEALIQSDNLPKNDLKLQSAAFDSGMIIDNATLTLDFDVRNVGVSSVTSFETLLSCEDAGISETRTVECNLNFADSYKGSLEYTFPPLEKDRMFDFTFAVTKVNGLEDENPEDNALALSPIPSVDKMYDRTVLLEEFTTEECINCPTTARNIQSTLATLTDSQRARVAVVCHHAGYGTDGYTLPCDQSYLWFYGNNGSYCPALMLDRTPTSSYSNTPVFKDAGASAIISHVKSRLDEVTPFTVNVYGKTDKEARVVTLTINGKANKKLDEPRVTVYLTEDDLPTTRKGGQMGAGTDYRHEHVIRTYNATWGVAPEWSDDFNYTYEVELAYIEDCKYENMNVVALISNYNSQDRTDCRVENAATVKLSELKELVTPPPAGMESVENGTSRVFATAEGGRIAVKGDAVLEAVHTISGAQVANADLSTGIYIVSMRMGDGSRRTVRLAVR